MITGGAELFCRHINEHFNTHIHQIPIKSLKSPLKERNRISNEIIQKGNELGVDVIVSNFSGSIFSGVELIKSNIPIMIIEHIVYPMLSIIERWNNVIDKGHSIFLVSKKQEKKYEQMSKRLNQKIPLISGFINPSFCAGKKPKIQDEEYDCITIGRCNKSKNPFKLHRYLKNSNLNGFVITSKTDYDDDAYFERNKHWNNTIWNQPHDVVMDALGKSKTYFSTWNSETWGIFALESLSLGIPIILNCDKTGEHSSECIPSSQKHYKKIPNNDKNALVDAIKTFDVDRKEVQDMTWEKHNLDKWKSNFTDSVSKTIDRFNCK